MVTALITRSTNCPSTGTLRYTIATLRMVAHWNTCHEFHEKEHLLANHVLKFNQSSTKNSLEPSRHPSCSPSTLFFPFSSGSGLVLAVWCRVLQSLPGADLGHWEILCDYVTVGRYTWCTCRTCYCYSTRWHVWRSTKGDSGVDSCILLWPVMMQGPFAQD